MQGIQSQTSPRYFLHPRYWSTWLGFAAIHAITWLPFPLRLKMGAGIGWLAFHLARSRRHIVEVNLKLCFPELTGQELTTLSRNVFRSTGMSLIETATAWLRDPRSYIDRFEIEGMEILKDAVESRRPTILLGIHLSTLDITGAVVGFYADIDVMYRRNKNPLFDHLMRKGREMHFDKAIERRDMREVIRHLNDGRVVWYGGDQDYGPKHSVFADFFGVQAATIGATARIAKMTGADIILLQHFRVDQNGRYRIVIKRPAEPFPTDDELANARQVNKWSEEAIVQYPDQYWWLHRRFKTRPPGEARPY